MDTFNKALLKAGLNNKFLLEKTKELIDAIKREEYKPRNNNKVLKRLMETKKQLIYRIENNIE